MLQLEKVARTKLINDTIIHASLGIWHGDETLCRTNGLRRGHSNAVFYELSNDEGFMPMRSGLADIRLFKVDFNISAIFENVEMVTFIDSRHHQYL